MYIYIYIYIYVYTRLIKRVNTYIDSIHVLSTWVLYVFWWVSCIYIYIYIYIYMIYIIKRHIRLKTWVLYVFWRVSYIHIYMYIYIWYMIRIYIYIYIFVKFGIMVAWGVSHTWVSCVSCRVSCHRGRKRTPPNVSTDFWNLVQPIAFGMTFNRNLRSRSPLSRFNGTWQKRPRELEHQLRFEIEETTLQMQ